MHFPLPALPFPLRIPPRLWLAWLALSLCLCGTLRAGEIDVAAAGDRLPLDTLIEYLPDPDAGMTLSQVQALPASHWQLHLRGIPNFGFTSSAYWFRFRLYNHSPQPLERLLEIDYPILDRVSVYQISAGHLQQQWLLGDKLPFEQRVFSHRNFVVPFSLPAEGRCEIWIRVRTTSSMQVPMTLRTSSSMAQKDQQESLLFGLYGGVAMAMLAYNLVLFLGGGRDRSYLYYLFWIASLTTFLATLNGLTFQYLWPHSTWWNNQVLIVTMCCLGGSASLFMLEFLGIGDRLPALSRAVRWLVWCTLLLGLAALVLPYELLVRPTMLVLLTLTVLIGIVSVLRLRAGFKPARFFALAFCLVLTGGAMLNFNKFGLIPRNWLTEYMTPIGSMVEMILFSLALADRFNNERRERERAQRQVVRSQANVLRLQQETNEELERRVAERTNELASANRLLRQYLERISRLQVISELGPSLVHEMKQPLAAIRTFAQGTLTLMDKQRLQAPQVSYGLNRILATIDEALELMARLRAFIARDASQREQIDLNDCVQEAVRWIRPMCSSGSVVVNMTLNPQSPRIEADPVLLRQVVLNLLRNALESISHAGSTIRHIDVETFSDHTTCGCRIRDSGPGIDATMRQHLFEPLFSTKDGGMGLGLKMSQSILEEFGGQLQIETPQTGASIAFVFPHGKPGPQTDSY